jgi:glycosyltransferase involved in cell wall biosynthesis
LKAYEDAILLLVGDGTERQKMMRVSDELGIGHAVRFTGFVNHADVIRYVNAADIAVVPVPKMDQELWLSPMKLFEYMASGKAVVASAIGQIQDVIHDGENGLLVPPGDPSAMATALSKLMDDAGLCSQIGEQARMDAVNTYSWKNYLSQLENIFSS